MTLFRNHPELAFELAAAAGADLAGDYDDFEHGPTEFEDPGRAGVTVHADLVLLARCDGRVVDAVAIEVQGKHADRKARTMPIIRAGLRSRYECEAWVLLVSLEPAVRRWARRHLFRRAPELAPLVAELEMVEPITELTRARRDIGRATLAAAFHARHSVGVACTLATLRALIDLDLDDTGSYLSLVLACLPPEKMQHVTQQLPPAYQNDEIWPMERESAPFIHGRQEGRQEGLQEARHAAAATLTAILRARGLALSPTQRERITRCEDLDQLNRWTVRAATADRPGQLFSDDRAEPADQ